MQAEFQKIQNLQGQVVAPCIVELRPKQASIRGISRAVVEMAMHDLPAFKFIEAVQVADGHWESRGHR